MFKKNNFFKNVRTAYVYFLIVHKFDFSTETQGCHEHNKKESGEIY